MVDVPRITFLVLWGCEQCKADPDQLKAQKLWHLVHFMHKNLEYILSLCTQPFNQIGSTFLLLRPCTCQYQDIHEKSSAFIGKHLKNINAMRKT